MKHYSIRTEESYVNWVKRYVLPYDRLSKDPRTHIVRCHHLDESGLQKATRAAGIPKRVGFHTFRHSFTTRPLE